MGMFPKEDGSLNIDETKIFIPLNFTPRIKKYESSTAQSSTTYFTWLFQSIYFCGGPSIPA
jgi:hypothetical protein